MKQNKLLKELVLDYTKVCDEMAQMQINKEKSNRFILKILHI